MFRPLTLTLALSALMSTASFAQDFSKTVFFGDSLSDTGRIKEIISGENPALGSILQDSFTTNPTPVWTRVLANSYGTSAEPYTANNPKGTNYTVGASQAGKEAIWNGLVEIPSTKKQIASYLANNNGKADPNALYSVWIGANDLFAVAENPSNAQASIINSATRAVADVETLNQAGAKLILVPNIPDLALTPLILNNPALATPAQQAAQLYNANLYNGLNQTTANVVPANTFKLLQEATANPTGFGFKNVTGVACANQLGVPTSESLACTTANLADANDSENYMFADAIHPAGRTHRILAQYYRSIIEAPAQVGVLTNSLVVQGNNQNQQMQRRLQQIKPTQNNWWVDGQVSHSEVNQVKTDGLDSQVRLGADVAKGGHNTGLYVQLGQQKNEIGKNSTDVQQFGLGLYHRYQHNQWRLQSHAGLDHLAIEHTRQVNWDGEARQHNAETDGQRLQVSTRGSYDIQQGNLTYTPYLGASYQRLNINDLLENQTNLSTAMKFHGHSQKSLQGELGLNVNYKVNPQTNIYGGLGVSHEFENQDFNITASLPSISQYNRGFTMPINSKTDKTAVNAHIGAEWQFAPKATLIGGINTQTAGSETQNIGGFIGVNGQF
ncbi:autotransporter domain-containing protein [Moraxella sp. ZY210820]|uniref:autotransporter domain-containing protein n=1 Tax=unclassified Moraxella TaxID=2685852 RepID=UPI00272FA111|nr:autotransporter domain-containing protein [Moraxella sp. ZY210820]WLF83904.1 autotransporter domain-containing protein [Moraxella sp. ZY210820]